MYVDIDASLTLGGTFNFATGSQIIGRGSVTLNAGQYNLNVSQTTLSNDLTFVFNGGALNYTGLLSLKKYAFTGNVGQLLLNANSNLSLGSGSWSSPNSMHRPSRCEDEGCAVSVRPGACDVRSPNTARSDEFAPRTLGTPGQ